MAGAEQKSFLGTLTPWSTPKSATSTPQLGDHQKKDVLQRSQGEDHTVTHMHRLSMRRYPPDCPPSKVRWFYAVDSPKRKPSIIGQKKADQKPLPSPKKFIPFPGKDSQSIEATFQKLSDIEDARQQNPPNDSEPVLTKVPVNEDFLFNVDVEQRELSPTYWIGPVYEVRRGTWFIQDGSSLKPCEENLATQLEEGYIKLCPWRSQPSEQNSQANEEDRSGQMPINTFEPDPKPPQSINPNSSPRTAGNDSSSPSPTVEPQQYRLFGAYMNRIVGYQDSTTAWLMNDDFMSRFSTSVYQKLGGVPGTKLVRGFEPRKPKETPEAKGPKQKPLGESNPAKGLNEALKEKTEKDTDKSTSSDGFKDYESGSKSTLERQMSSLAGEPQNPADLEEQARRQEEQEMEESREVDGADREREVDHLVLVTHGIGQRLGLRLESINFIHDVNVLRKTLKTVYKGSPDLQALNSAHPDSDKNCRVQVLPVCWRHLLDFPYRGVRRNRKELDLTDADALEDDAYPSLSDITLESVPAVRNLISDLAMDVLLYQSGYCEHISNIVIQECNRILRLYRKQNPSFKGSVSLCGHSLGSAILFDILCHQPGSNTGQNGASKGMAHESDDSAHPKGSSAFEFDCEEFFCLGSPIALFQMLKGKTIGGYSALGPRNRKNSMDVEIDLDSHGPRHTLSDNAGIISTPRCRDLYNIFHPSDPVSYRVEPLISPAMATLKPQPLPSVKKSLWTTSGQSLSILGSRMGQSVGSLWTNFTTGVASSLLNRSLGLNGDDASSAARTCSKIGDESIHRRSQSGSAQHTPDGSDDHHHTLIESDLETLYDGFQKSRSVHHGESLDPDADTNQDRRLKFEDAKVRALNANGRVDYSIQEGAFDISLIASIASHLTYWGDEDVNHFMLSQMLSRRQRHKRKQKHR
ncbi:hypothetical protein CBS147332_5054 [Penicillium roqueforti]|nr:hypothetical protein CBS147332_5054 [Penicillium roqueforti]KAI3095097.1 hypothetical protein CBS147331_9526 [Penicillium roqueforti]